MAAILRIRNWEAEYENSDTKKVKHFTRYLPVPNDLSSFEYARIVSHENGEALAGAWLALRCVASKGTPRGYLVDSSGEPHTVESLTLVTRFSAATIQQALRLFQFWKMLESCSPDGTVIPTEIEPQISEDLRTPPETSEDLRESPNTSENFRLEEIEERREEKRRSEEIRGEKKPPLPPKGEFVGDVLQVFDHYRSYHPQSHPKPSSESKEWRAITARLKEGHTADDLKTAIDGCHKSPYHCGENEAGRKYQSLELIVRDSSKVTQFIEANSEAGAPVLSEKTRRNNRAAQSYLARKGFKNDVE